MRANPRALRDAPQILKNVDFVRAAVLRDGRALEYAPEEVQDVIIREREAEREADKRKQQYSENDESEDDESEDDESEAKRHAKRKRQYSEDDPFDHVMDLKLRF